MRNKTESRVIFGDLTASAPLRPGWFFRAALLGPIPKVKRVSVAPRHRDVNLWNAQRAFTLWPAGKIPAGSGLASRFSLTGDRKVMIVSIKGDEGYGDPPPSVVGRWLPISSREWLMAAPCFCHANLSDGGESWDRVPTGLMAARPR